MLLQGELEEKGENVNISRTFPTSQTLYLLDALHILPYLLHTTRLQGAPYFLPRKEKLREVKTLAQVSSRDGDRFTLESVFYLLE